MVTPGHRTRAHYARSSAAGRPPRADASDAEAGSQGIGELDYPFHDFTITVTACGRICIGRRKINLSTAFAGQNVGIREVADAFRSAASYRLAWPADRAGYRPFLAFKEWLLGKFAAG